MIKKVFLIKEENSPINNVPNRSKVLKAIARTLDDTEFSNLSLIGFSSSAIFLSIQSWSLAVTKSFFSVFKNSEFV